MKPIQTEHAGLNQVGGRDNNEDFIYPFLPEMDIKSDWRARPQVEGLFVVCDGVGGSSKGEVASRLTTLNFVHYFAQTLVSDPDQAYLDKGLQFVEGALSGFIAQNPESRGMGTTLTLLYLGDTQATIAWAGDSRVYHVRQGDILYQTEDHSLVNELVRQGHITPEEARTHHNKNVILRAIQGQENSTSVDVHSIPYADLQEGDYFFLCTDGVEEALDDASLAGLLGDAADPEAAKSAIFDACQGVSRDNFSCHIVRIEALATGALATASPMSILEKLNTPAPVADATSAHTETIPAEIETEADDSSDTADHAAPPRRPFMRWALVLGLLGLIALAGLGIKRVLDRLQQPAYLALIARADIKMKNRDFLVADSLYEAILVQIPSDSQRLRTHLEAQKQLAREEVAIDGARVEIDEIDRMSADNIQSYLKQQQAIEAYESFKGTAIDRRDTSYLGARISVAKDIQAGIDPVLATQELETVADSIKAQDTIQARRYYLEAIELVGEGNVEAGQRLQTKLDSLSGADS